MARDGGARGALHFPGGNMGVHKPGFAARLLLQAEPRIMYSLALGQPGQSGQISFSGKENIKLGRGSAGSGISEVDVLPQEVQNK